MTRRRSRNIPLAIVCATTLAALAQGCDSGGAGSGEGGRIVIKDPVVRMAAGTTRTAAAYMTILNASSSDDRLLSVRASMADRARTREAVELDGAAHTEERPNGFRLPARRAVKLEPGGKHVMLLGVDGDVTPGGSMMLELRFEKSGSFSVEAPVEPAAG